MTDRPDPFAQDPVGRTALLYAAEEGDLEEVRRIIHSLAGTDLWPSAICSDDQRQARPARGEHRPPQPPGGLGSRCAR